MPQNRTQSERLSAVTAGLECATATRLSSACFAGRDCDKLPNGRERRPSHKHHYAARQGGLNSAVTTQHHIDIHEQKLCPTKRQSSPPWATNARRHPCKERDHQRHINDESHKRMSRRIWRRRDVGEMAKEHPNEKQVGCPKGQPTCQNSTTSPAIQ